MNNNQKKLSTLVFFSNIKIKLIIIILALITTGFGLFTAYYQKFFFQNLDIQTLLIAGFSMLLYFTGNQFTFYLCQLEAIRTQNEVSSELYRHLLQLNSLAKNHRTGGELLSHYTTDIPSMTMWLEQTLPFLLFTFLPLITTPIFLHLAYEISYMQAYGVILFITFANLLMAKRQSLFFSKFKSLAANRMSSVNEWIQNIKNLRIYGWISSFENIILNKRKQETVNRIQMVTNGQMMNAVSSSIPYWLNLLVLVSFVWRSEIKINKSDILVLIWMVGVFLSRPLRQLPWLFTMYFDAKTSYSRLNQLFKIQNKLPVIKNRLQMSQNSLLEIKNLNLVLENEPKLSNICLEITKGEIVVILGPVGSGKSLLFKSIIADLPFTADHFFIKDKSFLPQDPFVFSSKISQNLTFSYSDNMDMTLAQSSLAEAQFDIDQLSLQQQLNTQVGERGLNLSGGQKQRLHLARLFYNSKNLTLLDDPFSALDVNVEKKLIEQLKIKKNLNNAFLISTQRYSIIDHADRVIFMHQGKIVFDGATPLFKKSVWYHPL